MASINTIVKRKQYLWLGIVVVGTASAIGGALYLSDVDMSGNGETVAEQEPVPDMTGVVDTTFDDKVRQHATTEMQVTAAQMQKQYEEIRRELDVLNKQRGDDQRRIEKLGQDNAALAEQVKALGANPVTATGEPVPQMPASPPGPEGEPQPGNTPVSFPPQGSVAVPPPTAFYPGNGVTPPPQVTYQSVPVPNRIQRKVFTRNEGKQGPSLPYIPSGSFAKAMLIEGADANASVTGNESTVPMQLRITGLVEMPNSKTYDATGCFVGLEAWGDVSSERAIVRTRNISCLKDGKTIDMPIIRDNEGRVFARQGEVMNPLQYVPFNQTLYFINGDDPAQVAWMKRQTPPTLESKIILVQGSIPEMQKSLDSRVYFDQNGVLCQRLGIDQVPARVSAVPGDRFLKVEFIPAEEGRK
ncbi:conjugal transfer protein TraB [Escherichia coli]|nr:conjugal transfer protein TraB [Escherichia coli]